MSSEKKLGVILRALEISEKEAIEEHDRIRTIAESREKVLN